MARALLTALLIVTASGAAAPAPTPAADGITWIRSDGAPGWSASIPRSTAAPDTPAASLVATVWLPKVPSLDLSLARGGTFDLGATRGKVVLLDFWASWCGPCLAELPHLERLHAKESGRGLVAVAVNAAESAEVAAAAARQLGLTMTIALDQPALYRAFRVRTLPTLVLADREGRIRARWDGYRPGLETTVAEKVDKLLADDTAGTERELAKVATGAGRLRALWFRDLPGPPEGIAVLPPAAGADRRVIAVSRGQLIAFDARGDATARSEAPSWAGKLLAFGNEGNGGVEVAAFRPGATRLGVIAIASGAAHEISAPAPIVDVAADLGGGGTARRLVVATLGGTAVAGPKDEAAVRIEGVMRVRDVAPRDGGGTLVLRSDGSLAPLGPDAAAWPAGAGDAAQLLAAGRSGAAVGPRTVIAAVTGRFLPGRGRQLAIVTYAGHVAVVDLHTGAVVFDAVWADARDLAAGDLDGDGLDELVVVDGQSVAALSAAPTGR